MDKAEHILTNYNELKSDLEMLKYRLEHYNTLNRRILLRQKMRLLVHSFLKNLMNLELKVHLPIDGQR